MELKHVKVCEHHAAATPLNRTILELKLSNMIASKKSPCSLNRTILELKPKDASGLKLAGDTLNRTILELKRKYKIQTFDSAHFFKSYHFGIETKRRLRYHKRWYTLNRTILELKPLMPQVTKQ